MSTIGKMGAVLLLSLGMALAGTASYAAEDHTDSGSEEGHSGGKGKGPKYMGGERGSSHTSETHKGGTSHHDSSEGGSTSLEDTIFRGNKPPGAGAGEDGAHETGETDTEHSN